jgi:hypothetical protein
LEIAARFVILEKCPRAKYQIGEVELSGPLLGFLIQINQLPQFIAQSRCQVRVSGIPEAPDLQGEIPPSVMQIITRHCPA